MHEVHDILATGHGGLDIRPGEGLAGAPLDPRAGLSGPHAELGADQRDDVMIARQVVADGRADGTAGAGDQDSCSLLREFHCGRSLHVSILRAHMSRRVRS
jgi:hypothetical protein